MSPKKSTVFNFEKTIEDLESIVAQLEEGGLSLEEAMTRFAKGIKLTHDCYQVLQQAEQKVKILLEKHDEFTLVDFAADELGKLGETGE